MRLTRMTLHLQFMMVENRSGCWTVETRHIRLRQKKILSNIMSWTIQLKTVLQTNQDGSNGDRNGEISLQEWYNGECEGSVTHSQDGYKATISSKDSPTWDRHALGANKYDIYRGSDMVVAVKREGNVYTFNVEHERVMVAEH